MIENLLPFISSLIIITLGVFSFFVFFLTFRKKSIFHKVLLRHWSLGFFLISVLKLPTLLISIGFIISDIQLHVFYTFAFFTSTIGYLLFLRGALSLITSNKLWLNIIPLVFLSVYVIVVVFLYSLFNIPILTVAGFVKIVNLLIIITLLRIIFNILNKQIIKPVNYIVKISAYLFIFSWILFLSTNAIVQYYALNNSGIFEFAQLFSAPVLYILFSISYTLLFISMILFGIKTNSRPPSPRGGFVFGISSFFITIALSSSLLVAPIQSGSKIDFRSDTPSFVVVNESIVGNIHLENKREINAVDINVVFNKNIFEVSELLTENSIIKIWVDEPVYDNERGTIQFSGIIPNGFIGDGDLLQILFRSKNRGVGKITFSKADVFANDGEGSLIYTKKFTKTYYVRDINQAPPTVNQTGEVSFRDLSILLYKFGSTDEDSLRFDLNSDGIIGLVDLSIFISLMK